MAFKEKDWEEIEARLEQRFGKKPNLQSILFLIGHRELGQLEHKFSKEQKQDLIHIAVCTLLSRKGYYKYLGKDKDGWPHFVFTNEKNNLNHKEQENLLKEEIIHYFKEL